MSTIWYIFLSYSIF